MSVCLQKQHSPESGSFQKVKTKLSKVLARGYIMLSSEVKSFIQFFPVPKTWKVEGSKRVTDDIRMVYDATRSGLNKAVWAPWFPMPTVVSHLRSVVAGTFMTDCDVGEMFLNFMLELDLRPYAGVDLTCVFPEDVSANDPVIRGWWERILMGFSPSPYLVTKDLMVVEQMIRGDRRVRGNVFGWKKVLLNFPGSNTYDPSMPWVYKVDWDSKIAADLYF